MVRIVAIPKSFHSECDCQPSGAPPEAIPSAIPHLLYAGALSRARAGMPEGLPSTELDPTEESAGDSEAYDGGPCRDRTYDQDIKSLLLYQLS